MKLSTLKYAIGLLILVSVINGCMHSEKKINDTPSEPMKEHISSENETSMYYAYNEIMVQHMSNFTI